MASKQIVRSISLIAFATAILFVCSQLTIPVKPIPFTMQTFAVMLISLTFSRWHAVTAIIIYLCCGILGLPVFANFSSGLTAITGLSSGYLWGFVLATIVMSTCRRYLDHNIFLITVNCIIGTAVICACGVFRLSLSTGLHQALVLGLYPFIIPAMYKVILAVICILFYQRLAATNWHNQTNCQH